MSKEEPHCPGTSPVRPCELMFAAPFLSYQPHTLTAPGNQVTLRVPAQKLCSCNLVLVVVSGPKSTPRIHAHPPPSPGTQLLLPSVVRQLGKLCIPLVIGKLSASAYSRRISMGETKTRLSAPGSVDRTGKPSPPQQKSEKGGTPNEQIGVKWANGCLAVWLGPTDLQRKLLAALESKENIACHLCGHATGIHWI